jgi:flavodoxin
MVAEAIGYRLKSESAVRLVGINELTVADFNDADLVVMGSPTHRMNLPEAARPVLDRLPKTLLNGKLFAAFDTSYKMSWWLNHFTAGKRLSQKLRKLGGKRILPPEIFLVTGREGPLYEGEIDRAKAWAELIIERSRGRLI